MENPEKLFGQFLQQADSDIAAFTNALREGIIQSGVGINYEHKALNNETDAIYNKDDKRIYLNLPLMQTHQRMQGILIHEYCHHIIRGMPHSLDPAFEEVVCESSSRNFLVDKWGKRTDKKLLKRIDVYIEFWFGHTYCPVEWMNEAKPLLERRMKHELALRIKGI